MTFKFLRVDEKTKINAKRERKMTFQFKHLPTKGMKGKNESLLLSLTSFLSLSHTHTHTHTHTAMKY